MDTKILLLGDSVFDNTPYVKPRQDVAGHLATTAPNLTVDFRAQDGATAASVHDQLGELLLDHDHVFMSVGGNDALRYVQMLHRMTLADLYKAREEFRQDYAVVLSNLGGYWGRLTVCTVYEPANLVEGVAAGLSLFNDVIQQEAGVRDIDILDLRHVCHEPKDFSNIIEPSEHGGAKIAEAILDRVPPVILWNDIKQEAS